VKAKHRLIQGNHFQWGSIKPERNK
jgi:hypothetical protein